MLSIQTFLRESCYVSVKNLSALCFSLFVQLVTAQHTDFIFIMTARLTAHGPIVGIRRVETYVRLITLRSHRSDDGNSPLLA